jgi:histidinol dehydrogenase
MIPVIEWARLDGGERARCLARPTPAREALTAEVAAIVSDVRARGDQAVRDYTLRFDGVPLTASKVGAEELAAAEHSLSPAQRSALDRAIECVTAFHSAQRASRLKVSTGPGVLCERFSVPLEAVGLYVPAGSAPLPSTAIMLGVPALLAGCPTRVLCTPPDRNGRAAAAVLAVAARLDISAVYTVGGAQAIAALAYGTESIPKVQKVFGPGNAWVTAAKLCVAQDPDGAACDLPAGPSEVLIIADESAEPAFVAADLLAQAEHDPCAHALLVTDCASLAHATAREIAAQLPGLGRAAIVKRSLAHCRLVVVADLATALGISNQYAPEHLLLQVREPRRLLGWVRAAGSVFLGAWTPETLGDYCTGANHVLPTAGYARAYSGLGLADFERRITVQEATPEGLLQLGPVAQTLAQLEGLDGHARAVSLRIEALHAHRNRDRAL